MLTIRDLDSLEARATPESTPVARLRLPESAPSPSDDPPTSATRPEPEQPAGFRRLSERGRPKFASAGSPPRGRAGVPVRTPVLGFEPRSEAPQASRIIQCSEGGGCRLRSYPTRAPVESDRASWLERAGLPIKLKLRSDDGRGGLYNPTNSRRRGGGTPPTLVHVGLGSGRYLGPGPGPSDGDGGAGHHRRWAGVEGRRGPPARALRETGSSRSSSRPGTTSECGFPPRTTSR